MKNRTLLELYELFRQTSAFYFTHENTSPRKVLNFMHDNFFIWNIEYCRLQNDIYFGFYHDLSIELDYRVLISFIENRMEQLK